VGPIPWEAPAVVPRGGMLNNPFRINDMQDLHAS